MVDKSMPLLYTVNDIMKIFHLGRTKAYQLMESDGFPSFKLNRRLYVESEKLNKWLEKTSGRTYNY